MKTEIENKSDRYLSLPYTVILRRDSEGDWIARVDELQGCSAHGRTQPEALDNLEEAKRLWIEDALEAGDEIPVPIDDEELPSGKWLQRTPRSLHKKLSELAKKEGVSLNQLATAILAEAVGRRQIASQLVQRGSARSCRLVWMSVENQSWDDWRIDQPLWRGRLVDALSPAISAIQDNTAIKVVSPRVSKKEHAFTA